MMQQLGITKLRPGPSGDEKNPYGIPEKGDARWLDQQGSYMATVAAGVAYKLLGAKDLGVSNDYRKEKMPPVNTPMLDGQLAWRQHDQGHQDQANMKWLLQWADKNLSKPDK